MKDLLIEIVEKNRPYTKEGRVADYIPELSRANPEALAISICKLDSECLEAGDTDTRFTIQSVSKIFTLIQALIDRGEDAVFSKVGYEPSTDHFSSIAKLEVTESHKPLNPFINAGAIVTTSLVKGDNGFEKFNKVHQLICKLANNDDIHVNQWVYNSEKLTGNTNRALAYYLKGAGIISRDVEDVLDAYFKLCSLELTNKDVATMASVLANKGTAPWSGEQLIPYEVVQLVLTIMYTCGLYNSSGEFAVKVGAPSKSGVGGCIMTVVPGKMGISVIGPALDERGNSLGGQKMLVDLAKSVDIKIF